MENANRETTPIKYIIQIKNHLDFHWENWFDGMQIKHAGDGETILSGYVADQCALHSLLEKVRNLNLTLISVQKVEVDKKRHRISTKEEIMLADTLGFIGGGRVTRIILRGLARAGRFPKDVVVSDSDEGVLKALLQDFPEIQGAVADNRPPASQRIVLLALHPPAVRNCLAEIRGCLDTDAVLISLAPKLTISQLSEGLGGFQKIIRMIPNAPSILNAGYNPAAFSAAFTAEEKEKWHSWFSILGESPEVPENQLEAYAILTAMGPTYLWFQLYELLNISQSFGLEEAEAVRGIRAMVTGAVECIASQEMNAEQVMDLIPVKPLGEAEAGIKEIYHRNLEALFQKLKV